MIYPARDDKGPGGRSTRYTLQSGSRWHDFAGRDRKIQARLSTASFAIFSFNVGCFLPLAVLFCEVRISYLKTKMNKFEVTIVSSKDQRGIGAHFRKAQTSHAENHFCRGSNAADESRRITG